MSLVSQWLGLDHPANKPLLDILNSVGQALASKAGLSQIDPGKLLLQSLLNKYAPQHLDPVMATIGGIGIAALENTITQAEGLPQSDAPAEPTAEVSAPTEPIITEIPAPVETPVEVSTPVVAEVPVVIETPVVVELPLPIEVPAPVAVPIPVEPTPVVEPVAAPVEAAAAPVVSTPAEPDAAYSSLLNFMDGEDSRFDNLTLGLDPNAGDSNSTPSVDPAAATEATVPVEQNLGRNPLFQR